jgi:tRNA pseudouridine55 synthase
LLSDQDVGDLRQGREIAEGDLLAPDWTIPEGFPDPQAPVRGFHQDRFCFLLSRDQGRLKRLSALRGGL